jgi:hypothetical protein
MANVHQFHKDFVNRDSVTPLIRAAGLYPSMSREGSVSGMSSASTSNYIFSNETGLKSLMIRPLSEENEVAIKIDRLNSVIFGTGSWSGAALAGTAAPADGFELAVYKSDVRDDQQWFSSYRGGVQDWKDNQSFVQAAPNYAHDTTGDISGDEHVILQRDFDPPLVISSGEDLRFTLKDGVATPNGPVLMIRAFGQRCF